MSDSTFPCFNFPYAPSEDLRQFFIDYGRTGPVHIFKHGENIECFPQKPENDESGMVLVSEKPTLPLNIPSSASLLNMDFESEIKPGKQNTKEFEQAVTNLASDHGDIVFGDLAKMVSEEAAELSWHAPKPLPFLDYYYTRAKVTTKLDPVIKRFEDHFCDIPFDLLKGLVQETYEQDKTALRGRYYGNCLAARVAHGDESNVTLVYPEGPAMNELCFRHLELSEDETPLSARLSTKKGSFCLPERICQISMSSDEDSIIALRTEHKCWLFGNGSFTSLDKPTFLGNLECKTRPCSVAVSPYIPEEVVVAMETGSLWLWNAEDSSVQVARQYTACIPEDFEWYFSVFGSHPRQVVLGNESNIQLIDLRGGTSTSQDLMTLPSSHFFPNDKFTSIQHYHGNPHHYFLATTQGLVIMDERFHQHPILKWFHSLEYPPKYINVLPSPSNQELLVFVGSYENHDVHCFQYCYGEISSFPLGMVEGLKDVLPPRSTSTPWKVSSYSEWPEIVEYPNKAQSYSRVTERLSQPLLGLSCVPHTNESTNALTVLQLSSTGDLFYQIFVERERKLIQVRDEGRVLFYEDVNLDQPSSDGCGSKKPNLSCKDKQFIARWVDSLTDYAAEESKHQLVEFGETCPTEDVSLIRQNLFSFSKQDVRCNLCSCENSRNVSKSSDEKTKSCSCCGLTNELSDRLANIRKSRHGVLTKENLGLNFKPEKLDMFHEDIQCDESLGNILLKNWNSDEQVPNESKSVGQPLEKECVSAAKHDSFARKSPVASTNIGRTASTPQTSANVANTSSPATHSSQRPKKDKIRRVPGF